MMEATQMTQNWMSHHVKQQNLSNAANSSSTGGNESNSQLSGKHFMRSKYFKQYVIFSEYLLNNRPRATFKLIINNACIYTENFRKLCSFRFLSFLLFCMLSRQHLTLIHMFILFVCF